MIIGKVISGGQTGADLAGLRAAAHCGISTGGTAPRHYKTEEGLKPNLGKIYGLKESHSPDYTVRTKKNVEDADITLVFTDVTLTPGSKQTIAMCFSRKRPVHAITIGDFGCNESMIEVAQWVTKHYKGVPLTINVAGSRESKCPGIGLKAKLFLVELFTLINEK